MTTIWVPPDLAPICAQTNASLTQCSQTGFMFLTLVAQLFGRSSDSGSKVYTNENSREKNQREEYDFIIVGAGSAGCVLANRLSEVKNWKILLLEAGSDEPDVTSVPAFALSLGGSSIDWNYKTQPEELTCRAQKGGKCTWLRGKTMGGSSAINYMTYMRGNRADYDEWADSGNHGWSYREVLPYFLKAENNRDIEANDKYYHSVGGPLNVERFSYVDSNTEMLVQALNEKGLPKVDLNAKQQIGANIAQSTSKDGRRWSANTAYIKPIRDKRPNLNIITEAFATKVIIDPITKTAIGVQYYKNGVYYSVYARKEVILSSGSLNSPKLLMLSGVGPKEHLKSLNLPVHADLKVGYNLQDHVTSNALIIALTNETSIKVSRQQLLKEVNDYYAQHPQKFGPFSSMSLFEATAFFKTKKLGFDDIPDIQVHFGNIHVQEFYSDPITYVESDILPVAYYDGIYVEPILIKPKSRGFLLLNNTDPVFSQPLIYPRFFTVKDDLDTLIAGMRFVITMEETEAFKSSGAHYVKTPIEACVDYPWGSYNYLACLATSYTATIFHPVGTCKMGPKWDPNAVVDPRLRVYGIKNLRVIDSAIMPEIVRGNTHECTDNNDRRKGCRYD